jgi:dephospho-CoA kinase
MVDLKTLQKQFGIGITGGPGTGKSSVCRIIEKCGFVVIDADQLSRKAVAPGSEGLRQITQDFGSAVLTKDGMLDRAHMRKTIFADPAAKLKLEAITHPIIREMLFHELARHGLVKQPALWFYEASLLFETGQYNKYRQIWLTHCSAESQIARVMQRDNISCDLAKKMIDSQNASLEEKKLKADALIDTDVPPQELERAVKLRLDNFPRNH